jgi:hypothetical protein
MKRRLRDCIRRGSRPDPRAGVAGDPQALPRPLPLDIRGFGHIKVCAADERRAGTLAVRPAVSMGPAVAEPEAAGTGDFCASTRPARQGPEGERDLAELTDEGRRRVEEIAGRHGLSAGAAETLLAGLVAGGGNQAQFSHPELGGMGQWTRGGMVMVGDMFNNALKAKVDALCTELAGLLGQGRPFIMQGQGQGQGGSGGVSLFVSSGSGDWWPSGLGIPAAVGSQNDLHYAWFPGTRRLAVHHGGRVRVFDTGDHSIGGVSQQQGGGQSITFTSQHGTVRLEELRPVDRGCPSEASAAAAAPTAPAAPSTPEAPAPEPPAPEATAAPAHPAATPPAEADVFAALERLADLRAKGILTEEEFAAKKAEMLSRL